MPPADLRAEVAAALEDLCAPGAPLHVDADGATWRLHAVSGTNPYTARYLPSRLRVHQALVEEFLGRHPGIATDGLAAVVTAGPPAGGKSTRLGELGYGAGWRRIDSDVFKLMLIEHDLHRGNLALPADVADLALPDRGVVMPLEVSGLYHYESTVLADKALEICMAARENVIVEGTLSWHGLVPQLVGDLVTHGYETLDVVLVEVPLVTALERALLRWWAERQEGGLGGRFTPAATIRGLYRTDTVTASAANAQDLVEKARAANLDVRLTS